VAGGSALASEVAHPAVGGGRPEGGAEPGAGAVPLVGEGEGEVVAAAEEGPGGDDPGAGAGDLVLMCFGLYGGHMSRMWHSVSMACGAPFGMIPRFYAACRCGIASVLRRLG